MTLSEFLTSKIVIEEAIPNQVNRQEWPRTYISLADPNAAKGVIYLRSRGLVPAEGMYYDTFKQGIVFPYFYDNVYVGAQTRMIEPYVDKNGETRKIDTVPGTRLGLVFYNWNSMPFMPHIKGIIVVESAFNAQSIQQALNKVYGGASKTPWRVIACSGSGVSQHHMDVLLGLVKDGYKVIIAGDYDEAGFKMANKVRKHNACTHYAFTEISGSDWNDVYQVNNDPKLFISWFFNRVKAT